MSVIFTFTDSFTTFLNKRRTIFIPSNNCTIILLHKNKLKIVLTDFLGRIYWIERSSGFFCHPRDVVPISNHIGSYLHSSIVKSRFIRKIWKTKNIQGSQDISQGYSQGPLTQGGLSQPGLTLSQTGLSQTEFSQVKNIQ